MHTGFGVGAGLGMTVLGTLLNHDLVFGYAGVGEILSEPLAEGKWYAGNLELWGELFAGVQYDPKTDYFAGLTPFIRYNFVTSERIVPFVEAGAGVSLTSIEGVDLEGKFQFNLQGGFGVHYFFDEDGSIVLQSRFFHFSNGGLRESNRGLNAVNFYIGYSWFY